MSTGDKKMNALVTGGCGFIGSHLVDELIKKDYRITVMDDMSTGNILNSNTDCNFIAGEMGDITKIENVERALSADLIHTDVVFHLAALPRVQFSIQNPLKTHNANVNGTLNVLIACKRCGVKRVIYSSSSSVYGQQEEGLSLTEDMKPNPMSPYALQKLTGEEYCRLFHMLYCMETISLRYFNVFGKRQDVNSAYSCLIPKTIDKAFNNEPTVIYGDGENTRDFNYVDNIIQANIKAAETENTEAFGKPFNIGSGKSISVNEIVNIILELAEKRELEPIHINPVIEPPHTQADNSLAKSVLGWEPCFSLIEGLRRTMEK